MKALVLVETQDGAPTEDSLGLLEKARSLGAEAWALVCGHGVARAAARAARTGAAGVLAADDPRLASPLARPRAKLIARLAREGGFSTILFAASTLTTELAAALAARLEAGLVWGLTDIEMRDGAPIGLRSSHADAMRAEIAWRTPVRIGLFRPKRFAAGPERDAQAEIRDAPLESEADLGAVELTRVAVETGAVSLAQAEVIVSGGRGIGKPENLALIRDLASALGGVAGVSLPLVDMGWAPRAMQVGQTGTVVSPRLYVACGISGQIQHRIGVERSGVIVAINSDRDAPIMRFCDLGVVGDALQIVPQLTALIEARRG